MTLTQFLEKLSVTSGWRLTRRGYIRRPYQGGERLTVNQQCPMTAVAGIKGTGWKGAALSLGLDDLDAIRIMRAADNRQESDPGLRGLRGRLLKACRLEERAGKR
jgi:hypothetical protein